MLGLGLLLPLPRMLGEREVASLSPPPLGSPAFKCLLEDKPDDLSIPRLPGPRKLICPVQAQSAHPHQLEPPVHAAGIQ